jgi:hypothetical protein
MTNIMRSSPLTSSLLIVAALGLAMPAQSRAATWAASFVDSVGDPSSVSIDAGQSFTFSFFLNMTGGASANAVDYYLAVTGNGGAGSGKFSIAQRDLTGSAFSDPNVSSVVGSLAPASEPNLGASTNPFANVSGNQLVATYTISTDPTLAPGPYVISIDPTRMLALRAATDENFDSQPIAASYAVTVLVPEPAAVGLLAMASLALGRRRSRVAV